MRRRTIPKHLHFDNPSPLIDWERLPVQVTSDAAGWPSSGGQPPLAAVNAYGISGTNAHVVVGGYQDMHNGHDPAWPAGAAQPVSAAGRASSADGRDFKERATRFLPLSGKSPDALRDLAERYLEYLDEMPDADAGHIGLADVAWTAGSGRSHFAHRAGMVFGDAAQLRRGLQALAARGEKPDGGQLAPHSPAPPKVAFVYTGQAGPWLCTTGKRLYETEPVFREVLDYCNGKLIEERGAALLDEILGKGTGASADGESASGAAFAQAVAKAYEAGMNVDFTGLFAGELRRRAPLPGYPFQRRRHWVDGPGAESVMA